MDSLGSRARVVAKIEKIEAYEKLDEILAVSDGVMVARGDYGVEAGVAHVPLMQKDTIARATPAGKLVITATQMLESMIQNAEPTRAEAADVANAVIDGSSAVMLCAETSVGRYPVEAVRAMAEIATAAEESPEIHGRAREVPQDTPRRRSCMRRSSSRARSTLTRSSSPPRPAARRAHAPSTAPGSRWSRSPTTAASPTSSRSSGASTRPDGCRRVRRPRHRGGAARRPRLRRAPARRVGGHHRRPAAGTPGATNLIMVREIP